MNKKILKRKKILIYITSIIITFLLVFLFLLMNYKIISGKISYSNKPVDEKFNVTVDSPILIRNVEMVQFNKAENGEVEKVFANYEIGSFGNYENPKFPEDIKNEVYYCDLSINDYALSQKIVKEIAYDEKVEKIRLENLPEIDDPNFIKLDDYYVSASNEWQIGELRISYYYIDSNVVFDLICKYKNNSLEEIVSSSLTKD